MDNYVLTCSSTADLSPEHFKALDVPYIHFYFNLDGTVYPDDLGQSMSFESFYKKIADGAMPTTSQPNVEDYQSFFRPFLENGQDVLHVEFSSALSGAINSAHAAAHELAEEFPERRITIIDSLGASSGYGLLMDTAAGLKKKGMSYDELAAWLEENRLKLHHWFFSTDLTSYKRGGRISATAYAVGSMLNLCPLLNMNAKGELTPQKKIRGKKACIKKIVNMMEEHAQGGRDYSGKCYISQSACEADAREVAALVEKTFPNLDGKVEINSVGTVIGSHTGPGTVALFFWGDTREN